MRVTRNTTLTVATAAVWLAAYALWTADWMVDPMPHLLARSLRRIPMCLFGFGCCWVMGRLLDRIAARGWPTRLAAALALCACASLLYASVNAVNYYLVAPLWGTTTVLAVVQFAMSTIWVFGAWCALYFAIAADADARDARLRITEARAAELRARNQALAQQVSPHFLFNALNAVSGLIVEGASAKAERVTLALAGLLRRSLEHDGREHVTLGEELDAAHRYLEIEEARFEHRLRVIDTIAADLRPIAMPALILQPLVENAIKHGVARSSRTVTVTLSATRHGDHVAIMIDDDARPDAGAASPAGLGIGVANVRERLALTYDGRASVVCAPRADGGFRASLSLPIDGPDDA